jgi:hypothetical protein
MEILKIALRILFVIIILASIFHWVRTRFWVPKYIHYLSALMFVVGSLFIYMEYSISKTLSYSLLWFVPGFPLAVYLIFGIYGGGLVTKENKINDLMTVDRALNKDEIVSLLTENLGPYRNWTYENLLFLSNKENLLNFKSENGKNYRFQVVVSRFEDFEENDDNRISDVNTPSIIITGILVYLGSRLYTPKSWASFIMSKNGEILKDGLITGPNET